MKLASSTTLARLLRSRLAESGDPSRTIGLVELIERIMPYAQVRAELGLAGKAEYDLALLAFLKRRDLIEVDPAVVAAVESELELPEPSLGFAAGLGDSLLRLREGAVASPNEASGSRFSLCEPEVEATPPGETQESLAAESPPEVETPPDPVEGHAGPPLDEAAGPVMAEEDHATGPSADPASADPIDAVMAQRAQPELWAPADAAAPTCWQCHARLPDLRLVHFCTNCGASQQERRCPECGDVVEDEWRFCACCGFGLQVE